MPHISQAAYGRAAATGYVTRAVIAASAMCAMHIARTITGMAEKIRWGVLGAANIAVEKVIPAMQRGARTEVVAIASLRRERGRAAAEQLGIERVHDSYEALLADPGIDAVYNPLPNHLHVPWSIRAAEAGKHVLCEKPIGLTAAEARSLLEVRDRTGVVIGEAFMARSHPQWLRAKELAQSGAIGDLRVVTGTFTYFNRDAENVRNIRGIGGGGLYDIGCYPITLSRMIFGEEPTRVLGLLEDDPDFGVDRLASAILDYPSGHATFTCSTQLVPYQRMHLMGTTGRVEIEIPFNAPNDVPCRILIDDGESLHGATIRVEEFPVLDQYTVQGDLFAEAIQTGGPAPTPLEEAVRNMEVIDAVFRSAASGHWESPAA
jgi:predicted dehydrogenase